MCCHLDMEFHSIWAIYLCIFFKPYSYILHILYIHTHICCHFIKPYSSSLECCIKWKPCFINSSSDSRREWNNTNLIWFSVPQFIFIFWLHTHRTAHYSIFHVSRVTVIPYKFFYGSAKLYQRNFRHILQYSICSLFTCSFIFLVVNSFFNPFSGNAFIYRLATMKTVTNEILSHSA